MCLAYKTGYCDAIMGRESKSPFKGFYQCQRYNKGYMDGQETGVILFTAKEGKTCNQKNSASY